MRRSIHPRALVLVLAILSSDYLVAKGPEVKFSPVSGLDSGMFSRRHGPATISYKSAKELLAEGYVEIGLLQLVAESDGKFVDLTKNTISEAARQGGDLVTFEKNNKQTTQTRNKNGRCTHTTTSYVYEPVQRCSRYSPSGWCAAWESSGTRTRTVNTCDSWEEIPYQVTLTESLAHVFRYDQARAASLREPGMMEAAEAADRIDAIVRDKLASLGDSAVKVTVYNACSKSNVYLATTFQLPDGSGKWVTEGWYTIKPKQTAALSDIASTNGNMYFFAESGSPLNLEWAGSGSDAIDAQVVHNRFGVVFGQTPTGTYRRTVKMFHKLYKAGDNTLTLKCD